MLGLAAASLFFARKGAKTVWPYLASHRNTQQMLGLAAPSRFFARKCAKNVWPCCCFPCFARTGATIAYLGVASPCLTSFRLHVLSPHSVICKKYLALLMLPSIHSEMTKNSLPWCCFAMPHLNLPRLSFPCLASLQLASPCLEFRCLASLPVRHLNHFASTPLSLPHLASTLPRLTLPRLALLRLASAGPPFAIRWARHPLMQTITDDCLGPQYSCAGATIFLC